MAKVRFSDLPHGYVLGRFNLASTVHVARTGPYEGPLCGIRPSRLWALIDDNEERQLCRVCRRWLVQQQGKTDA